LQESPNSELGIAFVQHIEPVYEPRDTLNPARSLMTGTICGIRIEEIEGPLMRELRTSTS
jgi:hypothetical protein